MEDLNKEKQSGLKLLVLLLFLFTYGFVSVLATDSGKDPSLNMNDKFVKGLLYVGQVIGVIVLFILPAVLFATLWTKKKIHYLGITVKPSMSTVIIASAGMLLAVPIINLLADWNMNMKLPEAFSGIEHWMKHSEELAKEVTVALTSGTSVGILIVNLFVIAFMAALSEEIFFRGILQKVLIEYTGKKHLAVWIGAALFSAFHMQFYGFIPRMLMGAYLGYMFLWSGSLWPGMAAHFINNAVEVFITWLQSRGTITDDSDKFGAEGGVQWLYVIVSIVMVTISMWLVHRTEMRKRNEIAV